MMLCKFNVNLMVFVKPFLLFNQGDLEPRLYGVAYDTTWRQVEELQEFLFYLWDQSFHYESSISYYAFTKPIENHAQEIPKHQQSYTIQTGGFAFQQILNLNFSFFYPFCLFSFYLFNHLQDSLRL